MVDKIFVREYISSLKEDGELDDIFVLLLESMGFNIIATPKDSKGQSQYGKDVIAVGPNKNGTVYLWNFELKGYSDKNLTSGTFNKEDGVRESLFEAKDTPYIITGKPEFNDLKRKIVFVHNGVVKETFKPQFDGFIEKNFKKNQFENWDINILTDLFNEKLFNEYLFGTEKNASLLRRILVFITVPEYQLEDLLVLLNSFFDEFKSNQSERKFYKLFTSLNLLMRIIWHYSEKSNDLRQAKISIDTIILKTWAFILNAGMEDEPKYKKAFEKLLITQLHFYNTYYNKTIDHAAALNGLFYLSGTFFENIGYPIRAFEYLDFLINYFNLENAFVGSQEQLEQKQVFQKRALIKFIENNKIAIERPILDSHLIPIHHLFQFFIQSFEITQSEIDFLTKYLASCFDNIIARKLVKYVYPWTSPNLDGLLKMEAQGNFEQKNNESSLLMPILLEYCLVFEADTLYKSIVNFLNKNPVSLQIARPEINAYINFEELFFSYHLNEEYYVDVIDLEQEFEVFKEKVIAFEKTNFEFKTEKVGFNFLIEQAETFYKNEPFPEKWRVLIN